MKCHRVTDICAAPSAEAPCPAELELCKLSVIVAALFLKEFLQVTEDFSAAAPSVGKATERAVALWEPSGNGCQGCAGISGTSWDIQKSSFLKKGHELVGGDHDFGAEPKCAQTQAWLMYHDEEDEEVAWLSLQKMTNFPTEDGRSKLAKEFTVRYIKVFSFQQINSSIETNAQTAPGFAALMDTTGDLLWKPPHSLWLHSPNLMDCACPECKSNSADNQIKADKTSIPFFTKPRLWQLLDLWRFLLRKNSACLSHTVLLTLPSLPTIPRIADDISTSGSSELLTFLFFEYSSQHLKLLPCIMPFSTSLFSFHPWKLEVQECQECQECRILDPVWRDSLSPGEPAQAAASSLSSLLLIWSEPSPALHGYKNHSWNLCLTQILYPNQLLRITVTQHILPALGKMKSCHGST
ncbi:hypothetical protein DV515_00008553, partial [Chloebia gouldiae]